MKVVMRTDKHLYRALITNLTSRYWTIEIFLLNLLQGTHTYSRLLSSWIRGKFKRLYGKIELRVHLFDYGGNQLFALVSVVKYVDLMVLTNI